MSRNLVVSLLVFLLPIASLQAGQEGPNEGGGTRSSSAWSGTVHRPPEPPRYQDNEERAEPRGSQKDIPGAPIPPPPLRGNRHGRAPKKAQPVVVADGTHQTPQHGP